MAKKVKVRKIELHPAELYSEMARCIAYCIGATYDDAGQIADLITEDEIMDCIDLVRSRMCNTHDDDEV